jgi:AcrR family transcriptional regulator
MVETQPARRRTRPATRKGRPTLTRELIAERALDVAGVEGFPAVTMRRLAAELGVTVRALYNYVADRQEVVELAAYALSSQWATVDVSVDRWEDSLRAYCAQLRKLYRRYPRALLVSLDENLGPSGVHPARLRNPDAILGLLRGIGLTPGDTFRVHTELGLKLFAFALLIDYRADHPSHDHDPTDASPVPAEWLSEHSDLHVPYLAEASKVPKPRPDELFAYIVDTLVLSVRALLPAGGTRARER